MIFRYSNRRVASQFFYQVCVLKFYWYRLLGERCWRSTEHRKQNPSHGFLGWYFRLESLDQMSRQSAKFAYIINAFKEDIFVKKIIRFHFFGWPHFKLYQPHENWKCRPPMETHRHPAQSRETLPKTYFACDRHLVQFRWGFLFLIKKQPKYSVALTLETSAVANLRWQLSC